MAWQDAFAARWAHFWHWRVLAGLLIIGSAAARLCYLALDCPLDLSPDEAHYWDWSRRLDWSYYSKGPLVAYLIRAACAVVGPWSVECTGSEMFAVRLPAVVCGSLLLLSLYVLTTQVYQRESLATAVVAVALTFPLVTAGSTLMTIDAPYTCCWGWALVLGHRAVFRDSTWAWFGTGLAVGLGILAKYTMVLWPISLGFFLLARSKHRTLLTCRGFWLMCGTGALCSMPILIWNAQHDWITVRHLTGLAGMSAEHSAIHWLGPLNYLGTQFAVLLGYWFVAWTIAMLVQHPRRESNANFQYLWWMSAPGFLIFLLFSFRTGGGEANWPVTAYLSGMVLTAGWLMGQLHIASGWRSRAVFGGVATACAAGLGVTLLVHRTEVIHPLLARFSGKDMSLRRVDPTCRLRGWHTLAREVDRVRVQLNEEGTDPVIAGANWTLPGELAFYCQGRPTAYCLSRLFGDRHSQYDFWHPNPHSDGNEFLGRTFVVIGGAGEPLATAFDEVEDPTNVTHYVNHEPVARWKIHICRGFRGCSPSAVVSGKW